MGGFGSGGIAVTDGQQNNHCSYYGTVKTNTLVHSARLQPTYSLVSTSDILNDPPPPFHSTCKPTISRDVQYKPQTVPSTHLTTTQQITRNCKKPFIWPPTLKRETATTTLHLPSGRGGTLVLTLFPVNIRSTSSASLRLTLGGARAKFVCVWENCLATNQNEKSLCFLHPEDQITFFFFFVEKKFEAKICEQVVSDSTYEERRSSPYPQCQPREERKEAKIARKAIFLVASLYAYF